MIALLGYIDKLHSKYRKLPLYDVDMIIRPVVKWLSNVGFDSDEFRSSFARSNSCIILQHCLLRFFCILSRRYHLLYLIIFFVFDYASSGAVE